MLSKQNLINEIETMPSDFINEVYHYVLFLKQNKLNIIIDDITLASESSLAKDWLLPEEDEAWANL